jgi:hypothetical protein
MADSDRDGVAAWMPVLGLSSGRLKSASYESSNDGCSSPYLKKMYCLPRAKAKSDLL